MLGRSPACLDLPPAFPGASHIQLVEQAGWNRRPLAVRLECVCPKRALGTEGRKPAGLVGAWADASVGERARGWRWQ